MAVPRIATIGAGPGGLMFARILQNHGLHCTVFELDEDRHAREQGGSLDLHEDLGQLAMQEAGLVEEFRKHEIPGGEAMKLMKSDGSVPWDENVKAGPSRNRPEIPRNKLRDILIDSPQKGSIQWGRKFVRAEPSETPNKYDLKFADGTAEQGFDLVVGADGAWSRVRPLLTDAVPYYSGACYIEVRAQEASTRHPWIRKFVGSGTMFMFDEGRAIISQSGGDDLIRTAVIVRQPENWLEDCGIDWTQAEAARRTLVERHFGDVHADLKRLVVESSDGEIVPRKLWMLPVGTKWEPRLGVTLLGDAAHLMTPAAGVGVNVALADAVQLAQALLKRKDAFASNVAANVDAAVREYEPAMFERAKENMEKSAMGLKFHLSADGIDHRISMLKRRAAMIEARKRELEQKAEAKKGES